VYSKALGAAGFVVIEPPDDVQRDLVQRAITIRDSASRRSPTR
jgi:hypothetical protein